METILLVEDDIALAKSLREALLIKGYSVYNVDSYRQAWQAINEKQFQLIILDIQLPDGNGIQLCKEIRSQSQVPILFLTANDNENMLVDGLNSGGDDYMTKPFKIKELYARINALLRRNQNYGDDVLIGELHIDLKRMEVYKNNECLNLSCIDFEILKMLVTHKDQVITRRTLLETIEKDEYYVEDNTLSVHVKRLRDKLGTYHGMSYIETKRGIGYRINREVLYEDK